MKNKAIIIVLLLVLLFAGSCILFIIQQTPGKNQGTNESNQDIEIRFKNALEKEYPEFKDFENQESFAGKKVKFENHDEDRYYAYMILGSGLPIVESTCFRVDRNGRVFKIGIFPDPLDSYAGYADIDPKTCKGIK